MLEVGSSKMLSCMRNRGVAGVQLLKGVRCASLQVPHRAQLFIDNQWCDSESGRTFAVTNPATEEELFQCAKASSADVDRAVKSARKTFHGPSWGKKSAGKDRADMLRKMGSLLADKKEEFAILETLDNGKPIGESRADMDTCIGVFNFYADRAATFDTDKVRAVKTEDTDFEVRLVDEPVGVCGLVTPWNFPLLQAIPKIAPAIATGCSMVLKPSSVCTATTMRIGDLALEAGLPAGALNIISGSGSECGQALLDHPGTDYLSFTGSSGIGEAVLSAAAKRLVPTVVELGGKGAIVVFDDVHLDAIVDWIMIGIFVCAGQVCSATSRLIVHKGIEKKLLDRLVEKTKQIRIGNPLEESTQLGPLTTKEQFDITCGFVDQVKKEGGEIILGGEPVGGKGYWYKPTIIRASTDSDAWKEEIFGPVLCVQSFETEEEAIRLANDTPYGLGNSVCTNDPERCERVANELHAGVVWKNCSNAIPTEAPFGGFGKSGFGKEYGQLGMNEYLLTKVITGVKPGFSWEWYGGN